MLAKEETTDLTLEEHFNEFRKGIVGINDVCKTAYGEFPLVYADWIAEGRLYKPIEDAIVNNFGPYVSNPHSYSSFTGKKITSSYFEARELIKRHVNAGENDILVSVGHGMTGAMERLRTILDQKYNIRESSEKAVVFITHMEHHSNQTVWVHDNIDLVVIGPDESGLPDIEILKENLEKYKDRNVIIGSFTACSNVDGLITPYHEFAEVLHDYGGICIVDFAASAPYVSINMHPENADQSLDAIIFGTHKFLGGPGSSGILLLNKRLHCGVPSISAGGNVKWTLYPEAFGFTDNLEMQEDSGTPGYLQTIKAAMAIRLKEMMGVNKIRIREEHLLNRAIKYLEQLPDVKLISCSGSLSRIGVISFNIEPLHYNLIVRLLNDRFGIQTRGGWSCASNYSYYLFNYSKEESKNLIERMKGGNLTGKPGWVRLSLHPTMSTEELDYCLDAIRQIAENKQKWAAAYRYNQSDNEYYPLEEEKIDSDEIKALFKF